MTKTNRFTIILFVFIGSVLGSSLTLGYMAFCHGGDLSKLLTESPYLLNNTVPELSHIDKVRVSRLLEKNVIFSADDLLGQVGAFYTTIITTLISLIAAMSLFTFFFVKSSVEDKAESQAKTTAKQVIDDKINPKIEQIDNSLKKFDEQALAVKLDALLQSKVLDSLTFWSKVEESIYSKTEEALQDYDLVQMNTVLNQTQSDIRSIADNIQGIHQTLEGLEEKPVDESVEVIDLGHG